MNEIKVFALIDNEKYGLCQVDYPHDNSSRIEIVKDSDSSIFPDESTAKKVIEEHIRTRIDQKVDEYKLVPVIN